ncbi:MAG: hypothetical protein ACLVES_01745 [Faecalibacterium prausnitzii]
MRRANAARACFGSVGAAQRLELAVPGRLDAEGDAVDARGPEARAVYPR